MAKIAWPEADHRALIGKRISRLDGPAKSTGAAKYSFDINRPGMLYAKLLVSPHARADLVSIDTSAAEAFSGVKGVWKAESASEKKIQYAGQIIAVVAATTEEIAREALGKIKVEYTVLEHQVADTNADLSKEKADTKEQGNVDEAFAKADV